MLMSDEYKQWFRGLKSRIRQSQLKAAVKVNTELLKMYWDMGKDIAERQMDTQWGSGFFDQLSRDLKKEFPDMHGFSISNLKYIKRFYLFYTDGDIIRHQAGDELESPIFQIPWRHHIELLSKCKSTKEAFFYVQKTIENGWSRNVLLNVLDTKLYEASGKSLTNFKTQLPTPMSDLAQQILKDPYDFDFLTMRKGYDERELEDALVSNITRFLLELGNGFAYVGRQVCIQVGEEEFFPDLIFFNVKYRFYMVIELKNTKFSPSHLGQLGFYVEAVNRQMKQPGDGDTIGLLICKDKDKVTAEYALNTIKHPLGISEYKLEELIPESIKSSLPTIEEIEQELEEN
jgi:predicted nuclease of restriction endonuclease-like (RecB) superfamily